MDVLIENSSDPGKTRALFTAIIQGKIRIISNIIEGGLDVNVRNESMRTPLMQAVFVQKDDVRTHIVRMLLGMGSDTNAQDDYGRTVLMLAAFEPNRDDVVRRVIATGSCDPNLRDLKGDTALMHAVYGGNASVIRILVNSSHTKGILDVNAANNDNITPLKLANKLGQDECCKVLLEEGNAKEQAIKPKNGMKKPQYTNEYSPRYKQVNKPFASNNNIIRYPQDPLSELISSTSPSPLIPRSGYLAQLDPYNEKENKDRKIRNKGKKKNSKFKEQNSKSNDVLFDQHYTTPRSTVSFSIVPSMSRSNTFLLSPENFRDTQTPHSLISSLSRNKRLTPISRDYSSSSIMIRQLDSPDETDGHSRLSSWFDDYGSLSTSNQNSSTSIEKNKPSDRSRRRNKHGAKLSPLHSGLRKEGLRTGDENTVAARGTLLPAIRTSGRNINLVGSPESFSHH